MRQNGLYRRFTQIREQTEGRYITEGRDRT